MCCRRSFHSPSGHTARVGDSSFLTVCGTVANGRHSLALHKQGLADPRKRNLPHQDAVPAHCPLEAVRLACG
eukprot:4291673-Alexandrium_andersonii.AAC.1